MNQWQAPAQRQPLMVGTRFVYLNQAEIFSIRIDCAAAGKALDAIDKVSSLAIPVDTIVSKWRYDEDYVKTVLLSSTPRGLRELLVNPQMAEYIQEVYNLEIAEDNTRLDKQQKEWLKNLDLQFKPNQQHGQDELTYINNLVDHYIEVVEPILVDIEQSVIVTYTSKDEKGRRMADKLPLTKSIILI